MKTNRPKVMHTLSLAILALLFQSCGQQSLHFEDPTLVAQGASVEYEKIFESAITPSNNGKVDVLVVSDNSGSMSYEQKSIAKRFELFLNQLNGLDWQLGIVTTDVRADAKTMSATATTDGQLLPFQTGKYLIKAKDNLATAKSLFAQAIQRPESGSGAEQGLKATVRALARSMSSKDKNYGLIRKNAALSVIVVSDADETPFKDDADAKNRSDLLFKYITTKYPEKSFKFHSIIVKENDVDCLNEKKSFVSVTTSMSGTKVVSTTQTVTNKNESYGLEYAKISAKTGGVIRSVCQDDYSESLHLIGQDTSQQVRNATLDCEPAMINDSFRDIEVRDFDSGSLLSNYTVTGVQVQFDQTLPVGKYRIKYKCAKPKG